MSFSIEGESGQALSVSSNEVGVYSGKYVLRVILSGGGTLTFDSQGNVSGDFLDEISINGTLTVYNNADEQIFQTTLTAAELGIDSDELTGGVF